MGKLLSALVFIFFCSRLLKNRKKQKKKEFLIFFFVASMLKYLNVYNFYRYIHKIQFNKVSHYWFYRKLLASISLPYRLYHNVECFIRYIQGMYVCMYIHISVYIFSFILVLNIMLWKSMRRNRNESVEENEDEIDGKWWSRVRRTKEYCCVVCMYLLMYHTDNGKINEHLSYRWWWSGCMNEFKHYGEESSIRLKEMRIK